MSKKRITDFFRKSGGGADQASSVVDAQSESTDISTPKTHENEPIDSDIGPGPSKKKKLSNFQNSWKKDWPWLDTNEKGEMLCKYCIENKVSNSFTTGCTNFRTSTLARHVTTTDHKLSVVARSQGKSLEKTVKNVISQQEAAVTSAVDTVYWLAKENIATDKYPSLLELLEKEGSVRVQQRKKFKCRWKCIL